MGLSNEAIQHANCGLWTVKPSRVAMGRGRQAPHALRG